MSLEASEWGRIGVLESLVSASRKLKSNDRKAGMATRIKVKRILELLEKDLSANEIARTYSISKHSIQAVRTRASELGIFFTRAKDQSEDELFFPDRMSSLNIYHHLDYEYVHKELQKVGVTLKLLHTEYTEACRRSGKIAISYSKFCKDYGKFTGARSFANHIIHKPITNQIEGK